MSEPASLIVRADANAAIGTGHFMRGLALAQAFRDRGGAVTFACASVSPALVERAAHDGFRTELLELDAAVGDVADALATGAIAEHAGAAWVALDGYAFTPACVRALQSRGLRVLTIDDLAESSAYPADLVLNQNPYCEPGDYASLGPGSRLLCGLRHALLRREFATASPHPKAFSGDAKRLLVTLGGSDAPNVTLRVLEALERVAPAAMEVKLLVGAASPHLASLTTRLATSPLSARAELSTDVRDMTRVADWADLAIAGGGSTCWELMRFGVPTLVIQIADNQLRSAESSARSGATENLGRFEDLLPATLERAIVGLATSPARLRAMSAAGMRLVDGQGASRVVAAMLGPA